MKTLHRTLLPTLLLRGVVVGSVVVVAPLSAETAQIGQDYARSLDGAQRPHGTATIPAGDVVGALIRALVLRKAADDAMLARGGHAATTLSTEASRRDPACHHVRGEIM